MHTGKFRLLNRPFQDARLVTHRHSPCPLRTHPDSCRQRTIRCNKHGIVETLTPNGPDRSPDTLCASGVELVTQPMLSHIVGPVSVQARNAKHKRYR